MAVNILTWVAVSFTFISYLIIVYKLYKDRYIAETYAQYMKQYDLIQNIAWFCGIAMALCAFSILVSFLFMYKALK